MSSRSYPCKHCGTMFNNRSNKYRHESKYCQQNSSDAEIKSPSKTAKKTPKTIMIKRTPLSQRQRQRIEVKVKVKVKAKAKAKANSKASVSQRDEESNDTKDILEELNNLRARVQKMENEPRYNNWIIIGSDMFGEMIEKYGRSKALSFLTKSALTGDSVDIIKKLYLDGVNPEQYPIACKNYHHFRYLNDKREVIDDEGGQSVRKIFSDRAHKAMVLATNEMMQDEMEQFEPDPDIPNDMDVGDMFRKLGDAQCRLASIHTLDMERLAGMTNNPNHPFFIDEGET